MKVHNVFHADLLSPYRSTSAYGPVDVRPPPEVIEGEEEYEIESIIKAQRRGPKRVLSYLVKWKGYPDSENSWVKQGDLHAPELLKEFYHSAAAGRPMHKYQRPRPLLYIAPKHPSPLLHDYRLLNNIRNMSQTSQSSSQRRVFQAQFLDAEHEEFTADTAPQLARRSTPFSSPPRPLPTTRLPALPIPPRLGELATPELEGVVANPEAYSERNSAHSSVHLFPPNPTPGFNLAEWLADVQRDQNVARATAANIQNFQEELQRGQDPALGQLAPIPDHLFIGIPIWDAERRQQILADWRDAMRPDTTTTLLRRHQRHPCPRRRRSRRRTRSPSTAPPHPQ
jgi:hypothetical protein